MRRKKVFDKSDERFIYMYRTERLGGIEELLPWEELMLTTFSNSFQVATFWPELINKKVQMVESYLNEIQYIQRDGYLVASGSIKRQVRYLEFDGRSRKVEDRIQFEVTVGKVADPLEGLACFVGELRQEYYVFQPRKLGESQAFLEQGFELITRQSEQIAEKSGQLLPVLFETIVNSGREEALVKFVIHFPEPIQQPKQFNGLVIFKSRPVLPVVDGEVSGTLLYRSAHNILQELEFDHHFSILAKVPALQVDQFVEIRGEISDFIWTPTHSPQQWILELQINYHWFVLEEQEFLYAAATNEETTTAELPLFHHKECRKFSKDFIINYDEEFSGLTIDTFSWQSQVLQSGVLITATIELELNGLNQGTEVHRKQQVTLDEFVPSSEVRNLIVATLVLKDNLVLQIVHIDKEPGCIRVVISGNYQCQIYRNQLIKLVLDPKDGKLIRSQTLIETDSFSLFQETGFHLQTVPQSVDRIQLVKLEVQPQTRNGWLAVNGVMDVSIAYSDNLGFIREDGFRFKFQQSFLWNKLMQTDRIRLQPRLEYDTYSVDHALVKYCFLVILESQLFRESELPIKLPHYNRNQLEMPKTPKLWKKLLKEAPSEPHLFHLAMEGDLPLKLGVPREIANSRTSVEQFNYRTAMNAILVEGKVSGEIDYWDENGYLRREPVNLPFWKFLKPDLFDHITQTPATKLIPEISRFSFLPVRSWPWRKRTIRIAVEMEIRPEETGR